MNILPVFINKVTFADAIHWKYGMEINIDKPQLMRVSRSNESLLIKVSNRELKEVDHFKNLGSTLTRDGYCAREIKMRITIAKEVFNKKKYITLDKQAFFEHCFIWLRNLDPRKI